MASGILTIPNLVSLARLALIPVFVWLLLGKDDPVAAAWLFGFIGATDWVDGYLARRLNQVSEFGKLLDPVADRLAVFVALVAGMVADLLEPWFAVAILIREALIGLGALYVAARTRDKLVVRPLGKLSTLLVYSSVAWLFLGQGADLDWLVTLGWAAGIPGLILYWIVAVQYLDDARRAVAATPSPV